MKLLQKKRLEVTSIERIGGLIPVGKLTLVTGLPGSGKSYSTIKFLNSHGIRPIYFNLDETEIGELDTEMFGSEDLMDLLNFNYTDLSDQVIILDTYTRVEHISNLSKEELAERLEQLSIYYNATIILIAHPEEYVGKDGIFKDNITIARNCYEFLHLEKNISSSTSKGTTTKTSSFWLYINKGRGYSGDRIIENWMRGD